MKLRSRVVAVAAAAGLVAGFLTLGAGPAHAQDTVLVSCDRVAGSAKITPPMTNVALDGTAIATKGPLVANPLDTTGLKPAFTTRDCTGILATPGDGGTPDDVGPLTKLAGKLVGSATCNLIADPPITNPLDPLDGKLTMTYTTLTPLLKPWLSSTYIRVGGGTNPLLPDELVVANGIVTKGAGVGADVKASFIFAPYSLVKPIVADQSFIDSNSVIVAGAGSSTLGLNCIAGLPNSALASAFFGTDGTGLLGGTLDSQLQITLPAAA